MITTTKPTVTRFLIDRRDASGNGSAGVMTFGGALACWSVEHDGARTLIRVYPQGPGAQALYKLHAERVKEAIKALYVESNGRRT